jgi:hypothetical protein
LHSWQIHRYDLVSLLCVEATRNPYESSAACLRPAQLFGEICVIQTEGCRKTLSRTFQLPSRHVRRVDKQGFRLHAASQLSLLSIEQLATLRAGFHCVLLLLPSSINKPVVLGDLKED